MSAKKESLDVRAEIRRLAAISPTAYARERVAAAKTIDVRVQTLDAAVIAERVNRENENETA